jgi:hypothetical protein
LNHDPQTAEWQAIDTTTHQDHVIAHVIDAVVLAYFVLDEELHFVLDMEFVWTIYLDGQMKLVPYPVAINDLQQADAALVKKEIEQLLSPTQHSSFERLVLLAEPCEISEVGLYERGDERRLVLSGPQGRLTVTMSIASRQIAVETR